VQLARGIFSGMNFNDYFNLTNCNSDIDTIFNSLPKISFENKNKKFDEISKIFFSISNVFKNCPEIEFKFSSALEFANKAYHFPGKFLSFGVDDLIGFSMVKRLWDLTSELKKEDLTDAGKTLGEIVKVFLDSKFTQEVNLVFLENYVQENDKCLDILEKLKADLQTIMFNFYKDIGKVRLALNDFFVNLNNIPSACIFN